MAGLALRIDLQPIECAYKDSLVVRRYDDKDMPTMLWLCRTFSVAMSL